LVGIYAVVVKIMNPDAPLGWASMMSATVFIGGIILLLMGLIGEYIGRMFMGLNQQPQYVIRTKIKHEKEK
ncbi:MAG: glycosyltransferase, partial [Christensenellaceae bacterium]